MAARLYLITPPAFDLPAFAERLKEALDAGDVGCVQLRLKDVDDDAIRRTAELLGPIAQSRNVAFVMNDRPDLALATECDGVHVGQDDAPYDEARRLLGPGRIVGVTCYGSRDLAIEAADKGADYVAFGGFYPSPTKGGGRFRSDPEILRWWSETMTVPSCAIGGITPANCRPLVAAGVDFLAVISAVWSHPDGPGAAVKEFLKAIAEAT